MNDIHHFKVNPDSKNESQIRKYRKINEKQSKTDEKKKKIKYKEKIKMTTNYLSQHLMVARLFVLRVMRWTF